MKFLGLIRIGTYVALLCCVVLAQRTGHLPVSLVPPKDEITPLEINRFVCAHTPNRGVGFQHATMSGAALIEESVKFASRERIDLSRYEDPKILLQPFVMRWDLEFSSLDRSHTLTISIDDRTRSVTVSRG